MVDDLERILRECAALEPEEPPFEQETKPADFFPLGSHPAFRGLGSIATSESGDGGSDVTSIDDPMRSRSDDAVVIKVPVTCGVLTLYCIGLNQHRGASDWPSGRQRLLCHRRTITTIATSAV